MKSNYLEIPERLVEYRKIQKLNQKEMGKKFAVTQSHYYKLETGAKIISYYSLKEFEKNGGDICHLITGKSHYCGITDEYVRERKTVTGKVETIHLILWLVKQGLLLSNQETKFMEKAWKYVRLMDLQDDTSVWERIREVEKISQENMAARLDINIKRYRRIEKLEIEPDAEILRALYVEFGYSPMVIMNRHMFCMDEINKIWESFSEDIKALLKQHLDYNMQLIAENEKNDNIL